MIPAELRDALDRRSDYAFFIAARGNCRAGPDWRGGLFGTRLGLGVGKGRGLYLKLYDLIVFDRVRFDNGLRQSAIMNTQLIEQSLGIIRQIAPIAQQAAGADRHARDQRGPFLLRQFGSLKRG
jgi:hypothetical protein